MLINFLKAGWVIWISL